MAPGEKGFPHEQTGVAAGLVEPRPALLLVRLVGPGQPFEGDLRVGRVDGRAAPEAEARRGFAVAGDVVDGLLCRGPATFLKKAAWSSGLSLVNHGAVTFRQIEVELRISGGPARKSIQSCLATNSATACRLAWLRAMQASRPVLPAKLNDLPQLSVSIQSSTQSIDGVLMVSPSKMPPISLPALVMRKILGIGQAGL